jgi:hypothetical protein
LISFFSSEAIPWNINMFGSINHIWN